MAPPKKATSNLDSTNLSAKSLKHWCKRHLTLRELQSLLTEPAKLPFAATLYLVIEIFVNVLVIQRVPYTEIDWRAYMQEVEGFLNGTYDYSRLRGDTGPLVYPAGFVYVYSALYYLTSRGSDIRLAQYIFAATHILLLALVFRIYAKTKKVPPYALIIICCTSYRIHSIFVLRLFNDPVAMTLFYASLNCFIDERWYLGSVLYSCAVAVKMNVLLFAPALLIAYLTNLGFALTIVHLATCAAIQLVLGLPFLLTNPVAYIAGSFDLSRVFEFKWTVNWRFLPEHLFVSGYFHGALLLGHLCMLLYFARHWLLYLTSHANLKQVGRELRPQMRGKTKVDMSSVCQLFVLPFFAANFIGVAFSRSLHYQFYIWYYHTLPYLAWYTSYRVVTKFVILGVIELCWNTYPSTILSSASLHVCHAVLLYGLYRHKVNTEKEVLQKLPKKDLSGENKSL